MVDASMSTAIAIRNPFSGKGETPKGEGSDGLLGQIAENTAKTVEILQAVVTGTPQERAEEQAERTERRQEKLEQGETDKPSRLKGFVSGMGSKISGLASSLNPFGSGFAFGNIGRVLLAGGGIALIRNFGEQFIDPLADMLQEISDKGFKKTLIDIKDNIKERLEPTLAGMKLAFNDFMDAIGRSVTFVKSIYTMINDYIMSFDTKGRVIEGGPLKGLVVGDGKLDMEELDFLKEDLQQKIVTGLGNFISGIMGIMFKELRESDFLQKVGLGLLLYGPVSSIFGFAGGGAAAAGATRAPMSAMQKLSIFALLAFGIRQTYKSYHEAMVKTLDENAGNFNFTDFAAYFLGGTDNAKGSTEAAYNSALRSAGTGALIGLGVGTLFGGVGAIFGGAIGLIAGGFIGYLSGQAGTDRIKEIVDGLTSGIQDFIEDIGNFFIDISNGFRYLVTGRGFMKGYRARRLGDAGGLQEELSKEKTVLEGLKRMKADYGDETGEIQEAIEAQEGVIAQKEAEIIAQPSMAKFNQIDSAELYLGEAVRNYNAIGNRMFKKNLGDSDGDGLNEFTGVKPDKALSPAKKFLTGAKYAASNDKRALAALRENATLADAFYYYEDLIPRLRKNVKSMKSSLTGRDLSLKESSDQGTLVSNPYVLNPDLVQQGDLSSGVPAIVNVPPINQLTEATSGSANGVSVNNNNIIDNSKEGSKSFTINQGELDAFDKSSSAGVVLSDALDSRLSN